jgi:hypothetical protein
LLGAMPVPSGSSVSHSLQSGGLCMITIINMAIVALPGLGEVISPRPTIIRQCIIPEREWKLHEERALVKRKFL